MDITSLISVSELTALGTVILTDIALAGDNAIVVGMAAAALPAEQRRKAIFIGILAATVMRILFSLLTTQLLAIVGLLLAGGILLVWVAWKLWREIRDQKEEMEAEAVLEGKAIPEHAPKSFKAAVTQIVVADASMSLDNVLAVAGAAREHVWVLVFGLALSVVLMGLASTFVARMLTKHRWIAYVGLFVILYIALRMVWDGSMEVMTAVAAIR